MDSIRIKRVGPGDVALLANVEPDVFSDEIDQDRLAAYLCFPASMLVVALSDDLVVGQLKAAVHLHPDKAADLYIDELAVTPSRRGRGIAKALIEEAQRWAAERGCADVWLAADPDNHPARALYERLARSKPAILYYWDL